MFSLHCVTLKLSGTSCNVIFFEKWVDLRKSRFGGALEGVVFFKHTVYAEENLVTALVPSETACLASSPGNMRRTAV
jgi:hypothetical protein